MRTLGGSIQFLIGQRQTALERSQTVLEVGQLLPRHQVDRRQIPQLLQTLILEQPALAPVVIDPEPGPRVKSQVRVDVRALQVAELPLCLLPEARGRSLRRIEELRDKVLTHVLQRPHPLVIRRKHRLCGGEIRCSIREIPDQGLHGFDLSEGVQADSLRLYLLPAVRKVLERAGRREGLQRFEEALGGIQLPAQVVGGIVVEKPSAPELKACLERLPGEHQPLDPRIYGLLQLLYRLFPALRHKLRHARYQFQQLEERRQRGNVPRLRTFDVLETDEVGQRRGGKRRDVGRVELPAGNGEHEIAGVDEARQHDHHPVRLQAIRARRHVLDVVNRVDQLAPVENLALALVAQKLDDVLCVA